MALISDRLDRLVDVHFKSRKWSFGWLKIIRATDVNGAQIYTNALVNGSQLLKNRFQANFIDQTVIEFLQRICHLFNSPGKTIEIYIPDDQSRSWEIICQQIWPLINDNIYNFCLISDHARLQQLSSVILCNCAKLELIGAYGRLLNCQPKTTPAFVNAYEPANFIIRTNLGATEPFELKNNLMGERLTLRQIDEDFWLLWEEEAIEWDPQWNCISIAFKDCDIGDEMLNAKAGPSATKK
uniref:Uncharacterized protein n=1 Tax=Globodera rostochiensis TaxID=31243 RepID=A0A914IEK5_GLORO